MKPRTFNVSIDSSSLSIFFIFIATLNTIKKRANVFFFKYMIFNDILGFLIFLYLPQIIQ